MSVGETPIEKFRSTLPAHDQEVLNRLLGELCGYKWSTWICAMKDAFNRTDVNP